MNLIQRIAASDPHQPIRTFLWNLDRDLRGWKDEVRVRLASLAQLAPVDAHLYDEVRSKGIQLARNLDQVGNIVLNDVGASSRNNPYCNILLASLARFIVWTADEAEKKLTVAHCDLRRDLTPLSVNDTPTRSDPPDGPPKDYAMHKRL